MSEYCVPGVYLKDENDTQVNSIEGVSTNIAGFVGAVKNTDKKPEWINSFEQFRYLFGECVPDSYGDYRYLSYAVCSFFINGGKRCYIVPVYHSRQPKEDKARNLSVATGVNLNLAGICKYTETSMRLSSLYGIDKASKIQITVTDETGDVLKSGDISITAYYPGSNSIDFIDSNKPTFLGSLKRDLQPKNTVISVVTLAGGVDRAENTLSITSKSDENIWVKSLPDWKRLQTLGRYKDGFLLAVESRSTCYTGAILEVECNSYKYYYRVDTYDKEGGTVKLSESLNQNISGAYHVYLCEFKLETYQNDTLSETFDGLSMNPGTSNYFMKKCSSSKNITLEPPKGNFPYSRENPFDMPANDTSENGKLFIKLIKEDAPDDEPSDITIEDIIGKDDGPGKRTGIYALEDIDNISIIAVPGITDEKVHQELIAQCERLKNRLAILDIPRVYKPHIDNSIGTSYAAVYHPWIQVENPFDNNSVFLYIPPSGAAAGIYSRVDDLYGVQKAPANEVIIDAIGVEYSFNNEEQEKLIQDVEERKNDRINLIRAFKGRGIRIWGARTCSDDEIWKYINVRRLIIYIKESVKQGTEWVVFEPNNSRLWETVKHYITDFLTKTWSEGYLAGEKPEDAFFVKVDNTTMTQNDIDNGFLIAVIGIAPVKPAEFIVFSITQSQSGSDSG